MKLTRPFRLLAISLVTAIALVASFALAYDRFVRPLNEARPVQELEALREEGQQRLEAALVWRSSQFDRGYRLGNLGTICCRNHLSQ